MSQLLQIFTRGIFDVDLGDYPPEGFTSGLPHVNEGMLAGTTDGVITHYHQGLPFDIQGRLCVTLEGTVIRFGSGAAPFDAFDRICVTNDPLTLHSAGIPYAANQNVAVVAEEDDQLKIALSPGEAGDYFQTPDSVETSVTTSMSLRWFGALDSWALGSQQFLMGKESAGNDRSYKLQIGSSGGPTIGLSVDGTAAGDVTTSSISPPFADGSWHGIRADWDMDAQSVTFYKSDDGIAWEVHQIVTGGAVAAVPIFDSTAGLELFSARNGTAPQLAAGRCLFSRVFDGLDPETRTLASSFNPQNYISGTSWVDGNTGQTWNMFGNVTVETSPAPPLYALGISPGDVGDYFSTPSTPLNEISGDISIRWFGRMNDWQLGSVQSLVNKEQTSGNRSWRMDINSNGNIGFGMSADGSALAVSTSGGTWPIAPDNTLQGIRVDWNSVTKDIDFYHSADGENWEFLSTGTGDIPAIFTGTVEVSIAAMRGGNDNNAQSVCRYARVYSDLTETTVAINFEPSDWVAGPTFVDPVTGATWTINGNASIALPSPGNLVDNSSWAGASGSVGGADFVAPTDWSLGFWPPDDAIVEADVSGNGDNGVQFIATAARGYLAFDLDFTNYVGQQINFSLFIDEVTDSTGAYASISGGNVTVVTPFPAVGIGFVGRIDAVYQVTGPTGSIRVGAGVTSNITADFKASRPQFTLGADLRPYMQT